MACEGLADERLQADKMDVLYGEADVETRARLAAHLDSCEACREELEGLARLRKQLRAWRSPARRRPAARPLAVPRWLAAAAALLLGTGLGLGASGYVTLRRALTEESRRAARLEQEQRQTARALAAALARPASPLGERAALDARIAPLIDERIRASEARIGQRLELRLADWDARSQAQRRLDLARVAEGLSYLDGRHGQQLARTNELMSYVLAAQKR